MIARDDKLGDSIFLQLLIPLTRITRDDGPGVFFQYSSNILSVYQQANQMTGKQHRKPEKAWSKHKY